MCKKRYMEFLVWLSLAVILTGCASSPSCYFRKGPLYGDRQIKVVMVPFTNLTIERDADKKVSYALMTYLLRSGYFDVVEVGETQKALKAARARLDEGLSIEDIKKMGELTGADVLLMGAVEEYKIDSDTVLGERIFVPEVSISARLVSTKSGAIIWAANHHRRGDDKVTVFGMGRIESISALTDIILCDIINSLIKAVRAKWDAAAVLKSESSCIQPRESTKEETKAPGPKSDEPMLEQPAPEEAKIDQMPQPQPAASAPKDERQQVKDEFKIEYEKIKSRYD